MNFDINNRLIESPVTSMKSFSNYLAINSLTFLFNQIFSKYLYKDKQKIDLDSFSFICLSSAVTVGVNLLFYRKNADKISLTSLIVISIAQPIICFYNSISPAKNAKTEVLDKILPSTEEESSQNEKVRTKLFEEALEKHEEKLNKYYEAVQNSVNEQNKKIEKFTEEKLEEFNKRLKEIQESSQNEKVKTEFLESCKEALEKMKAEEFTKFNDSLKNSLNEQNEKIEELHKEKLNELNKLAENLIDKTSEIVNFDNKKLEEFITRLKESEKKIEDLNSFMGEWENKIQPQEFKQELVNQAIKNEVNNNLTDPLNVEFNQF